MSDDEPKDEPSDDSEQQGDEQAADSDQSTGQAEEQPTGADQSAVQSEEQPADSDQQAEQSEEQPASSDQVAEQSEGQPAEEADQPAGQPDEATGGGGGGGGAADDAVAADSGKKLQVTAEFTQEGGQKFVGDMSINVYDGKHISHGNGGSTQIFPPADTTDWQFAPEKGNVITTPILSVTSSEVLITAGARVLLTTIPGQGQSGLNYQYFAQNFVFPMPGGGTLKAKFEVEVANLDEPVDAPNASKAISIISQGKLKGKVTFPLKAQAIQRQRFRVTGKYFTGNISLRQ